MRRSPLVAAVVLSALSLTACGSRLDSELRQDAADVALGRNGGSFVNTGDGTAPGTDQGTTAGGPVSGPGTTTGGTTTGGGVPAPPGGNGGATDVGVTGTTLSIGAIADLAGPVPGLFQGAIAGTQAYVAKVNAEGGVFGRKLKLNVYDSQMDCGQYQSATQRIIEKDFANVGSFSLYDGCGVQALSKAPNVPDVHSALQNSAQAYKNNFSVAPLERGWRTGPLEYFKKRFGDAYKNIGSIYASVGGGAESWANCRAAIQKTGGGVAYERAFGATETDFTADIIQMRQRGVQMIYMPATNAATAANVLKAAKSQGVNWPIVFGGPAYDRAFLSQAGAQAEGVFEDQQYALFFNEEDARNIPGVADFQKWMKLSGNGNSMDLFAAYGWSSGMLFVQALKAAGPKATRADVLAQLRKITKFDGNGILAPADPAGKHAPRCWLFSQVKSGKWVRVDTPTKAFRCDGGYFLA